MHAQLPAVPGGVNRLPYARGVQEVGGGIRACLQPDGGRGWSNAGLNGGKTVLAGI